ncbi:DUF7677 family protein [Actinomadura alba]|uniref:DUF7677 domain-containing protein n=1 Tax=Actinomadura alba TaxID=406431 RepID=A0ABR7M2F6_9ACTN|nr:hypothetical protein [Actinomadura alba]MBC6471221.1 hypothetical protein [Actinomadura alba]
MSDTRPLPPGTRSDLRFFAFYLGNGTLLLPAYGADDPVDELDYTEIVTRYDDTIGRLFAILLDGYHRPPDDRDLASLAPYDRVEAWLAAQCDPARHEPPSLTDAELALAGFDEGWKDATVAFGRRLGRGTLVPDVLDGLDYVPDLFKGGSLPEAVVMVFANVLRIGSDGTPVNAGHAERRAAQWLRRYLEHDYRVDPPFEHWEFELL